MKIINYIFSIDITIYNKLIHGLDYRKVENFKYIFIFFSHFIFIINY